jgi:hypothetical protein
MHKPRFALPKQAQVRPHDDKMAHKHLDQTTVVLTGVAQEGELETLTGVLRELKTWVHPVGKMLVLEEPEKRRFFRHRVKLDHHDIPRLRAVLDFHSNGWDASSRFETVRELRSGSDVRRATPDDEKRAVSVETKNREAELLQLNLQVNT